MSFVERADSREAYNEKIKLVSHTAQNFGVALTIALISNLMTSGWSPLIVFSAIVATFMFVVAYRLLGSLEGEDR